MSERLTELLQDAAGPVDSVTLENVARRVRDRRLRRRTAGAVGVLVVVMAIVTPLVLTGREDRAVRVAPSARPGPTTLQVGGLDVPVPSGWSSGHRGGCQPIEDKSVSWSTIAEATAACLPIPNSSARAKRPPATQYIAVTTEDPSLPGPLADGGTVFSVGAEVRDGQPVVVTQGGSPTSGWSVDVAYPLLRSDVSVQAGSRADADALLATVRVTPPERLRLLPAAGRADLAEIDGQRNETMTRSTDDVTRVDNLVVALRALPAIPAARTTCALYGSLPYAQIAVGAAELTVTDVGSCQVVTYDDGNAYAVTPQLRLALAALG